MTDDNNHEPISLGELRHRLHQRREAMRKKLEAKKLKENQKKGTNDERQTTRAGV